MDRLVKYRRSFFGFSMLSLILSFCMVFAIQVSQPPKAEAIGIPFIDVPSPCGLLPDGFIEGSCKVVQNPADAADRLIGKIPGIPRPSEIPKKIIDKTLDKIGDATVDKIMTGFAVWMARPVVESIAFFGNASLSIGSPDITGVWFQEPVIIVYGMSFFVAILALLYMIAKTVKDADPVGYLGALFRFGIFYSFVGGGALIVTLAGFITVVDKVLLPNVFQTNKDELQKTFEILADKIGESITAGQYIGILWIALFFGWIFAAINVLVLAVRFMVLPYIVLWIVFAFGLTVTGQWGFEKLRNSLMTFFAWVMYPWFIGFFMNIGLKYLQNADGFWVTIYACLSNIVPFIAAGWVLKKISSTNVGVLPVQKIAIAAAGYNNITKALVRSKG